MSTSPNVVSRFAPSPTGNLHIGGVRTALFAWLYARAAGGEFLLRIEDTDTERSQAHFCDNIIETLDWLGLDRDREILRQSERTERYRQVLQELLDNGEAYWCACSPERLQIMREEQKRNAQPVRYDGHCRDQGLAKAPGSVVRLRVPDGASTQYHDLIYGDINPPADRLNDLVLWRSDDTPVYNLSVVVDDADQGVTHVVRGEDHLLNVLPQMLIYQAVNRCGDHDWGIPEFAHLPMVLAEGSNSRLSKRTGGLPALQYRDDGILPDAVLNVAARLGWSHGDQELFTVEELIKYFDLRHVQSSPAHIDAARLLHINALRMQQLRDSGSLLEHLTPYLTEAAAQHSRISAAAALLCPRSTTLKALAQQCDNLLNNSPIISVELADKFFKGDGVPLLIDTERALQALPSWDIAAIEELLEGVLQEHGGGSMAKLGKPMRLALSGEVKGAPVAHIAGVLGRETTLERLAAVL